MRRPLLALSLALPVAFAVSNVALAQNQAAPRQQSSSETDLSAAKPGRDPGQAIDEDYTRKIREYTT